jgi:hypothetical protein
MLGELILISDRGLGIFHVILLRLLNAEEAIV